MAMCDQFLVKIQAKHSISFIWQWHYWKIQELIHSAVITLRLYVKWRWDLSSDNHKQLFHVHQCPTGPLTVTWENSFLSRAVWHIACRLASLVPRSESQQGPHCYDTSKRPVLMQGGWVCLPYVAAAPARHESAVRGPRGSRRSLSPSCSVQMGDVRPKGAEL